MSGQIQWDASLVKKFGCSNHFKLLNQLRTEIKAYPIKRRNTNTSSINQKISNNINQSEMDNLEGNNLLSSIQDKSNKIKNKQSQSLFKSKHNSINNTNSSITESSKVNISNEFRVNSFINPPMEEINTNIYNNNEKINKDKSNYQFSKIKSSVSFNDK